MHLLQQMRLQHCWACLTFAVILHLTSGWSTCAKFGNDLTQGTAPTRYSQGIFANVNASLSCPGNATKWNMCFYGYTTDTTSITYLGVYRLQSGSTYNLVPGSLITYPYAAVSQSSSAYTCSSFAIPPSEQYTVTPGDILMACVQSRSRLGIVGVVNGASVLRISGCSSLPTDPVDINPYTGPFTQIMDYALHINLEVNECAVNNGRCTQVCNDLTLGYNCSCYSGYVLDAMGQSCIDINECSNKRQLCSQVCKNTNGSYLCSCWPGYKLSRDRMTCYDINECSTNNTNCSQSCKNTNGSYLCSCYSGYQLMADKTTCAAIKSYQDNETVSQICTGKNESQTCLCDSSNTREDAAEHSNCSVDVPVDVPVTKITRTAEIVAAIVSIFLCILVITLLCVLIIYIRINRKRRKQIDGKELQTSGKNTKDVTLVYHIYDETVLSAKGQMLHRDCITTERNLSYQVTTVPNPAYSLSESICDSSDVQN